MQSVHEKGLVTPAYIVKERGQSRPSDHMNERVLQPRRPLELVLSVQLPRVRKVSSIDLDVSDEGCFSLEAASVYELKKQLPYPVYGEKAHAKWDKASQSLTVTIPVQPAAIVAPESVIGQLGDKTVEVVQDPSSAEAMETSSLVNDELQGPVGSDLKAHMPSSNFVKDHSRWLEPSAQKGRMNFPVPGVPETASDVAQPLPPPPPSSASDAQGATPEPVIFAQVKPPLNLSD